MVVAGGVGGRMRSVWEEAVVASWCVWWLGARPTCRLTGGLRLVRLAFSGTPVEALHVLLVVVASTFGVEFGSCLCWRSMSARQGHHGLKIWSRAGGSNIRWAVMTLARTLGAGSCRPEWRDPRWQNSPRWRPGQRREPRWFTTARRQEEPFRVLSSPASGGRASLVKSGQANGQAAATSHATPLALERLHAAKERSSRGFNPSSPLVLRVVEREVASWVRAPRPSAGRPRKVSR